jgi:tetratricopeptide (TPR) repeat protein
MFRQAHQTSAPLPRAAAAKATTASLRHWQLAILLALVTAALYWPVTRHQFVNYDDDVYVTRNVHVQQGLTADSLLWALRQPVCGNWHPVTIWSHMLDCQLYHLDSWGHHLTNLLLHALNAALVFLLLYRLTGSRWRSACVAAVFAWHPLHVESVAWLAERKDVLSAAFGWLALLLYARHAQGPALAGPGAAPGSLVTPQVFYRSPCYWLAWLCFALGLMSKPMLVTWPGVMLLLDYWPLGRWQRGRIGPLLIEKIPFLILAAADSVLTFWVQQRTGAMQAFQHLPLIIRGETALIAYARYLEKLFWPVDLAVVYPHPGHWPPAGVLVSAIGFILVTAWVWRARQRQPFLPVGWFWFVGTLVPVIGLVPVGIQSMADRYTYIPSVGVLIMIVWGGHALACHWRVPWQWPGGLSVAVLLACATLTERQIGYWQNSQTLFQHSLAVTADNVTARVNLGIALLDAKQPDAAILQFDDALRLQPNSAEAHNNLGEAWSRKGQYAAAVREYRESMRIEPDLPDAYNDLGTVLVRQGQTNEAIHEFQAAIQVNPNYVEPYENLGSLMAMLNQTNEAIRLFQAVLKLKPDYADVLYNYAHLLARIGQSAEAGAEFAAALRAAPQDAQIHYEYANLLAANHHLDEAIDEQQAALELKPDFSEAHNNLGNLLAQQGHADEAIRQFQAALRGRPDYAEAHNNLGNLLASQGRTNEANGEFQEALRLQPDYADAHFNLGAMFARYGQLDAAIREFGTALRLRPDDPGTHYKLGNALAKIGQGAEAAAEFQTAIRLKPDFYEAHNNLGSLWMLQGRTDEAIQEFAAAVRAKPDLPETRCGLGNAWLKKGQVDQALEQFQAAVQLAPDSAPGHYYLGVAFTRKGAANQAIHEFQEAIRLKPDYALAHNQLGIVLGDTGQMDAAIQEFQAAVRLKPDYAEAGNNLARALQLKNASH